MTTELLKDTQALAARVRKNFSNQRLGQSLMNALADLDFDRYRQISGTDADCFYDDRRVPDFFKALEEQPKEKPQT